MGIFDKAKDMLPDAVADKADGLIEAAEGIKDKAVDALPDSVQDKVEDAIDSVTDKLPGDAAE